MKLLLRLYPPKWRERYGAELEATVADVGGLAPGIVADLVVAAVRERLREPAVVVLQAWAIFVLAGIAVQKQSEHIHGVRWAFDGLVAGALVGAACIVVAAVLALPAATVRLRAALVLTLVAAAATGVVVWWANRPSDAAWASHAIGIAWALLLVATLGSWTSVGVAAARQASVNWWLVRGVALTMVEMTVCTTVWWSGTTLGLSLLVPVVAMVIASTVGVTGALARR